MKDALLIHLDPDAAGGWCLVTDHLGNGVGAPEPLALADAALRAAGRRVVVLLPAERCAVLEVQSPTRDRDQFRRALPALLEDRLAGDVEAFHFTAGAFDDAGRARVVAIEHAVLDGVVARCAEAGIDPAHVVPDALCLAPDAVLLAGGRALIGVPGRVAAVALAAAPLVLDRIGADRPLAIRLADEDSAAALVVVDALSPAGHAVDVQTHPRAEIERLLFRGVPGALAFDLCHGRHRRREAASPWRPWRLAAALAVAWLGFVLIGTGLEVGALLRERAQLRARLQTLLPQVAPEAVGQPDPGFYLQRRASGTGTRAGIPLDRVARIADAVAAIEGTEIRAIEARSDAIEVALRATDLAGLERARGAVEAAVARPVELRGANAHADRAEGKLFVPGGAG